MSEADESAGPARRRRPHRVGRTGARFPRHVEFDEPETAPDTAADDAAAVTEGTGTVGRTGARFNSRGRRERRDAERIAAEDAAVPVQARPVQGRRVPLRAVVPDQHPAPAVDDAPTGPIPVPAPSGPRHETHAAPGSGLDDDDVDDRVWVRPYVRTRGRTRARGDLRVETLVSLRDPRAVLVDLEHRAIGEICLHPRSVAEVAARTGVPLGVARVLIDDMAAAGLLTVHPMSAGSSGRPDLDVMRRVLDGLHRI